MVALAVPVLVAVAWFHLFGAYHAWATPVQWAVCGVLTAAALATAWAGVRKRGSVQIGIAAFLLAAQVIIIALTLAGVKLCSFDLYPDARVAIVVAAACGLATYGLVRRQIWGRWLAIALGAVGAVSGGINAGYFWNVTTDLHEGYVPWSNDMFGTMWVMLVCALGGVMIAVNLVLPSARDACSVKRETSWLGDARLAKMIRPMLVTAFAAVPMLLVYAWLQPIVPATQTSAVILAGVLAIAAFLTVRGKLIGAIVLVVAGLGMFVQTAATFFAAPPHLRSVAEYYVMFWLPAAVFAIVCGVRLAGPTWRLLRGR